MPNIRLIPLTITEIALIQFSLVVPKGPSICRQHAISPKGEVSRDGLESWQGCHMEALQAANEGDLHGRPSSRGEAYALILVAGGDKACNHWDTLEDMVDDPKKVDQVWDAFEKSFEQSTSFWYFRDAYLADFRQDPLETMADLDLCIKQTVRGCQWKKESEEE